MRGLSGAVYGTRGPDLLKLCLGKEKVGLLSLDSLESHGGERSTAGQRSVLQSREDAAEAEGVGDE